ncbi:MAG TPA: histidine kinase [Saprospiraceae bacterium]|nr:histidine kinase [Saprospiraceae bacterium]HPN68562.1 histidine kinase [Saprospiraceae bacterium]
MLQNFFHIRKKWLGFNDLWLILFGTPLVGFIMSFMFYEEFQRMSSHEVSRTHCFYVGMMYTFIYWIIFTEWSIYMRKKLPSFDKNQKRIILTSIGIVVLYFLLDHFAIRFIKSLVTGMSFAETGTKEIAPSIGVLLISFLCISIYENIYYNKRLQDIIVEKEMLAQANLRSELEGLKNQINPHFFFNSLNTLTDIVSDDPKLAIKYIQNLSKLFRYILESGNNELTTLESELAAIQSFSFILLERFKGNLQIIVDIEEVCKYCYLPPMSLQMLIENCIKHNVISSSNPLRIVIVSENDEYIVVANNFQTKLVKEPSMGLGLENIKKRYRYFTDKEVVCIQDENQFMVKLPLLELNPVTA